MKILKVSSKKLNKTIQETAELLKEGKIEVCPTYTVYGFLCDATNKKAVEKLFKIKKRSKSKAIPIFVKDIEMAKKLAFIDKKQEKFLNMVWFTRQNFLGESGKPELVKITPKILAGKGKVTVILKRNKSKIKLYGVSKKTIGLRIPDYKLINKLLLKINRPLTGTSANISGKPSSTKIKEVIEQFGREKIKPDFIIDVGNLDFSLPSIVLDLTGKKIKILRI